MNVQTWKIDKVLPYPNNPRENAASIDKVILSLREYGWQQPIVVDREGVIVVGHTRWQAARKMGLAEVPVLQVDLSEAKARAYRIADNRTREESGWDMPLLKLELEALTAESVGLDLTGFDASEFLTPLGNIVSQAATSKATSKKAPAGPGLYLVWPGHRVAITEEQCETLNERLRLYVDERGMPFGFARSLIPCAS